MLSIQNRFVIWLATGGYSGYLPRAPGTWGSGVGVVIFCVIAPLPLPVYSAVLGMCIAVGIWTAGKAEVLLGRKDASAIVIDEIAGMLLTYYTIPIEPGRFWLLLLGFGLFRFFDIYKTLPQLEYLPGGWGIMSDDLWAACLAQSCLRLVVWYS